MRSWFVIRWRMIRGICTRDIMPIPGLTPWGTFFRPLRGLSRRNFNFPGLTPWAGFFRPLRGLAGAGAGFSIGFGRASDHMPFPDSRRSPRFVRVSQLATRNSSLLPFPPSPLLPLTHARPHHL
jgi:hypothetical protein